MKKLTTKQAWQKLAGIYERYASTGLRPEPQTEYQSRCSFTPGRQGLCAAIGGLYHTGQISIEQYERMRWTIREHLGGEPYFAIYNAEGAGIRTMMATLFAEDAGQ
jgi:hypothetical protein